MMGTTKAKDAGKKKALSNYELQKMETLKQNAALMEAKGHGSLAIKIYEDQARFHSANAVAADVSSDENEEDYDYTAEEESDGDEAQISLRGTSSSGSKLSNKKVSNQPKKQSGQQATQSSTKSSSMAEYLQKKEHKHVQASLTSGANQPAELQQRASSQMHEKQSMEHRHVKSTLESRANEQQKRRFSHMHEQQIQEFIQSIQTDLIAKLQEANPSMTLVIPEGLRGLISTTTTQARSQCGNSSGGQSSVRKHSGNQVQDEFINESPTDGASTHGEPMES